MFKPTNTNYAVEYLKSLKNAYPFRLASYKLRSAEDDDRFKFVNATTIQIPSIEVGGRRDATNDYIHHVYRRHNNKWDAKTLAFHRYFKDLIAPADIKGTNEVEAIANITKSYNDQQKFPEIDAYTFSKIYNDFTTLGGNVDTTTLTVDNVLGVFDAMYEQLLTANADVENAILFCTPAVNTLLKNAGNTVRVIGDGAAKINRSVYSIDDIEKVIVSPKLFKTAYDFRDGWTVKANAGQINMMLICPSAVITPEFYDYVGLGEPKAENDGKYVYYEESWADVFVLANRLGGIAINATPATTPTAECTVTLTVEDIDENPIKGADITVIANGLSVPATDNEDGTYTFKLAQGDAAKVFVLKLGYRVSEVGITATQTAGSTLAVTATLEI